VTAAPGPPLLALEGVDLDYGAVAALRGVDLEIAPGEAVGLCGDNGAGKSSLIKIISGAHRPSRGRLLLDGRELHLAGPRDALANGIATIYQDLALVPRLPVWQNLFLGAELMRPLPLPGLRILDKRRMREESEMLLARLGIAVPSVDAWVEALSGGQRQAIAIARALRARARLLVMDEPTAALGVRETEEVLRLVRRLKASGVAVLLVSHDMKDVVAVADRVVVLRRGRIVARRPAIELSADELAHLVLTAA
jgi:simple sugar transport system ATP-binding protein